VGSSKAAPSPSCRATAAGTGSCRTSSISRRTCSR
jgi:hypothetical protein